MKEVLKKIVNPFWLITHLCRYWPFRLISDKNYLKLFYRAYLHEKLDLDHPKGLNEKIQWLKLYDRRPEYTEMTDKFKVRSYVSDIIGEEYLIPLLGVWDDASSIDFDSMPNEFVLKCNHDSGSVIVCHNKNEFDIKYAIKKLNASLKRNYFWKSREYNYKYIDKKIIAEQLLTDSDSNDLTDYKFFCFNGEPKFIQVDINRFTNHVRNFYTPNWEFIDVQYGCKNDVNIDLPRPEMLSELLHLANLLSSGYPHIRVDFYISNSNIYFGELTFHHGGGVMEITPNKYDYIWGEYLHLPSKTLS